MSVFNTTLNQPCRRLHRNYGFYDETDESMWILYKNPGMNLYGFVTEIQDFNYVEFHTHKAEIVVNFDTNPLK